MMAWIKYDDYFSSQPAIGCLSDAAFRQHFEIIEHCGRGLTDGQVVKQVLERMPQHKELIAAGLYRKCGDHYELVHWPKHIMSQQLAAARKASGAAGGKASAQARAQPVPDPDPVQVQDPGEGSPSENSSAGADLFLRLWNEERGALPQARTHDGTRRKRMTDFVKRCSGDEDLLRASIRAFADNDWIAEKRYGIDTMLVPKSQAKWVEMGAEQSNHRGDSPERRAKVARALGCEPGSLEWIGDGYKRL